jgi:hypothetical protein
VDRELDLAARRRLPLRDQLWFDSAGIGERGREKKQQGEQQSAHGPLG